MNRTFSLYTRLAVALSVPAWLLAVPLAAQTHGHGEGSAGPGGGGHVSSAPAPAPAPAPSSGGSSGGAGSSGGGSTASGDSGGRSYGGGAGRHESGGERTSGIAVSRGGDRGGYSGNRGADRVSGGAVDRRSGDSSGSAPVTGSSSGSSENRARDRVGYRGGSRTADATAGTGGVSVPEYSRPRDGKPAIGEAVPRTGSAPAPGRGGTNLPGYYGGYIPWGFGGIGFGGYYGGYYDPYDPFGGYGGYGGYGGGYGGDPGYAQYSSRYDEGALKLKIKPNGASVYVDGYYAGVVDDFDGLFQKLKMDAGPHRIEVRAPGFETLVFEVRIEAERTTTYHGELKKLPQ